MSYKLQQFLIEYHQKLYMVQLQKGLKHNDSFNFKIPNQM